LPQGERKLVAIMFTDMVGYTALAQSDESVAMELLDEQRRLVRPFFQRYNGTEVKTIGDAFLVQFKSALEAVECASSIQKSLHELNLGRPPDRRIILRVGVHVGDVIDEGNDISGDAVNIASRIEPLAAPGGVCISEQAFDQTGNKSSLPMVKLERQTLKNVSVPMDVFRVTMPWDQTDRPGGEKLDRKRIAVLPFSNISPDPTDEYFADGMTEELINTISHNHQLKVIARTSVGRFKGTQKSVSEIGREIGLGSILEGSVRKAGNKIRVTAQLIDAATEEHVWSDNYDRQLDDVFSIQSEIAKSVSEALMARLVPEERKSIEKKATGSSAAYVLYLRGRAALRDRKEDQMREAERYFEEAIAEDRDFAEAYVGLADAYFLLGNYNHMPMAEAVERGREALARALALDDGLAEAHTTLANYMIHEYKFAEAESEFGRAIALSPSYALAHHWYGIYLIEAGRPEEALEETRQAEELDPLSPVLALNMAAICAFLGDQAGAQKQIQKLKALDTTEQFLDSTMAWVAECRGDFEEAVSHMERAVKKNPANAQYLSSLGFYSTMAGRRDRATEILRELDRLPEDTFGKPFHLAMVYAGLGERDEMFSCLTRAFDERSLLFRVLRFSRFDPSIRKDPRYVALFQRAGLVP
jgi:adenylate cyclase